MTNTIRRLTIFILTIISIFFVFLIWPKLVNIFIYILRILLPFIIAFILAYILQPIIAFTQKYLKKRTYSVFVTLIILGIIVFFVFKFSIPFLVKETKELINNYESILSSLEQKINDFATKFSFLPIDYQPTFDNIKDMIEEYINKIQLGPERIISKVFGYLSVIVIIPMTLIYFLIDYEKIICTIREKLIKQNKIHFKNYLGELNQSISTYIKTTFIIMLIMMVLSTVAFWIAGLDYPIFFGMVIAITNIIPYIGPYLGGILPVGYAIIESTSLALIILIIILVIQFVESEIISPYLHSKNNDVHPLLVILSIALFGKLFGLLGMIIAVPILSVIKITWKYYSFTLQRKDEY